MTVMTGRSIAPAVSPRARRSPTADLAEWRPRSLCRWVEDPDLFFDPRPERQRAAAAVCRGCPVRTQCLSAEVPHDDASYVSGVFGGLTETQRLALRGERQLGHVPHLGVAQRLAGPGWGTW
ncbi:WhiB family transcriptional regulator, partial [Streptomyces sp. NPDC005877]